MKILFKGVIFRFHVSFGGVSVHSYSFRMGFQSPKKIPIRSGGVDRILEGMGLKTTENKSIWANYELLPKPDFFFGSCEVMKEFDQIYQINLINLGS